MSATTPLTHEAEVEVGVTAIVMAALHEDPEIVQQLVKILREAANRLEATLCNAATDESCACEPERGIRCFAHTSPEAS